MDNKRDERENSLNRKKLKFAQKHEKKKHYHIARPAVPGQQPEPEDTALNAALETLVGGHHDTMRRFTRTEKGIMRMIMILLPIPKSTARCRKQGLYSSS